MYVHHVIKCVSFSYACLKGHTDIVKLLLDNNCEVIENNGLSPALHSACKGGSVDIVDLLLRNKYNINQCQIVRKLKMYILITFSLFSSKHMNLTNNKSNFNTSLILINVTMTMI
jgi:ankyrin repeat protein